MRILIRYMIGEFLKIFFLILMTFICLYLIIDIFKQMGRFIEHQAQFWNALQFFLYKIPFIFYQVTPVAILMATLISLGIFVRHNEITAALAGGIGIFKLTMPFFMLALFISGLNFILNESIIPFANQKVEAIKQSMEGINMKTVFAQDSIWFKDDRDIYTISYIEPENGILKGLTIYRLDADFNIIKRIDAREVNWIHGQWVAKESMSMNFQEGRLFDMVTKDNDIIPLPEKPENLKSIERLADEMNFGELRRYVSKLKKEGYTASRYVVDLHVKLSFPLAGVIMVMIGMPFALKSGKHGGIALGIGISVMIGFCYWVLFAINASLGYGGIIPPLLAAWFTNIIFTALGFLMLTSVKQ